MPLWGYTDETGHVVIHPRFVSCGERFYEGVAWASDPVEKRSGYINPDGTWAIIVDGSTHTSFVGGMGEFHIIGEDDYPQHGYVNRKGEVAVPPKYRSTSWYVDGYVLVQERTWIGRITDRLGKEFTVFPRTPLDTRAVILDKTGKEVLLPSR